MEMKKSPPMEMVILLKQQDCLSHEEKNFWEVSA